MKKIVSFFVLIITLMSQSLSVESRTLGGEIIKDSDKSKPWLASLNGSCTASVFDKKFILTAFHCIYFSAFEDVKATFNVKARGITQEHTIKNVYLPYTEHGTNVLADVVVLELTEDIIIDSYIKIPSEDFLDSYYGKQDISLLLGYGINDVSAVPFKQSTQLKLSLMNRASCDKLMINENRAKIEGSSNYFVCDDAKVDAQRKGKDIGMCAGDSGGPLTIQKNGEFYQIGVVSGYSSDGNSSSCGKNSAFYGSMTHHSKWINNILAGKVNPTSGYELQYLSEEGIFYEIIRKMKPGRWKLMGTSSKLNFDVSKIHSAFSIFIYKDKKWKQYTHTSESVITMEEYEGFWFYKKDVSAPF